MAGGGAMRITGYGVNSTKSFIQSGFNKDLGMDYQNSARRSQQAAVKRVKQKYPVTFPN